jgi:hypothetical protein
MKRLFSWKDPRIRYIDLRGIFPGRLQGRRQPVGYSGAVLW